MAKCKLVELRTLFHIGHGNKLDLNKMTECSPRFDAVAFVGRSGERNGIVGYVEPVQGLTPFAAGKMTVALGGAALSTFVQPMQFYTAQNIDVLTPIGEMSLDVMMYYCKCIEANRFRYSTFGREANRTLRHLLLPARDCVPAWVDGAIHDAAKELIGDLSASVV